MDDREMLQTILNAVSAVTVQLDKMEARLTAVDAELKNMGDRLDGLEAGQEALRRDVARIERKIDRQGNDIADTLYYITPNCAKPDKKRLVFTSAEVCKASRFCSHGRFYAIFYTLN